MKKIKNIIRNINSSPQRYALYVKCCIELKSWKKYIYIYINIDVTHRWNATYQLLDLAIKYRDVLDLYYNHLSQTSRCAIEKIDPND